MQPSPIADTSGPPLPRRRLPTWNILFSFLAAEPPPRLRDIKWDRHPLVTRCLSRNNRQFGTADPKRLGEELHNCRIGGAIGRGLGHPDLKPLTAFRTRTPATDPRSDGARRHSN